jgi:SOS response regulatory protein OraA/RecX
MARRGTKARTIDAVRALDGDPMAVEVRVGGTTVARMPRPRAEALGLAEGMKWTPALAARVDRACAEALAREAGLAFLARKAWSAKGLEARLVRAGHEPRAARDAVAAMVADGWLDDRAFAEARVEQLSRRGAMSQDALAETLEADGVGEAVAAEAARAGAGTAADLRAEARAARRAGERASRVAGRFARRGFDADSIRDALERAGYELDG